MISLGTVEGNGESTDVATTQPVVKFTNEDYRLHLDEVFSS